MGAGDKVKSNLGTCRGKACLGCGCCCSLIGIVGVVIGQAVFGGIPDQLYDNIYDLMFIDDTTETSFEGPAGDMVTEKKQFEAWKKSMQDSFKECRAEGKAATDCVNGFDLTLAVFNTTNAEDVVLAGKKPILQELGPIFAKQYSGTRFNIDEQAWAKTGIANYQQNTTYELNAALCDDACQKLLKAEIVVPNPVWATIVEQGAEMVIAVMVVTGGLAMQTAPEALVPTIAAVYGLSQAEAGVFLTAFIAEPDVTKKQMSIGAFLMTTQQAAGAMAQGDTSKTCMMGTMQLPAPTCLNVFQTLQGQIPAGMAAVGPMYGTGNAAPWFIRVTVAQALGFKASFTDPLSQTAGLSYLALGDGTAFHEVQMGSKFGVKGIQFNTKYESPILESFGALEQDCRWDPDCTLSSARPDSCQASETCTPLEYKGYQGLLMPARIWGKKKIGGKEAPKKGDTLPVVISGMTLPFANMGEKEKKAKKDGTEHTLKYTTWALQSLPQRLENCDGKGPGSPGVDCGGPVAAKNLKPLAGLPLFLSSPYFDTRALSNVNSSTLSDPGSYDPADRVEITRCTGHAWCDDKSPEKYATWLYVEPESGNTFALNSGNQFNLRIGGAASVLHPNLKEVIVPAYWSITSLVAPEVLQGMLGEIQGAPDAVQGLVLLLTIVGITLLLLGMCCCSSLILWKTPEQAAKSQS